jgi:uncharacterized protein
MTPRFRRDLTMPAGRVLGVMVIALLIAALFNSEAIVRAGESMQSGPTRDIVLSVARPLDDAAGAVGLHLPREGLDLAFGQEDKTAEGTELEEGSRAILRPNRRKSREQTFVQPTPDDPVELLVTGDSQAEFIGQLLTDELPDDLFDVEVAARNATGLTNPEFFNWEINAQQEIAARAPDAVVMVIGGNDGFNVLVDGQLFGWQDPQWQIEYARRAAVVMGELGSDGERPVYWVPPPTARDDEQNGIYETQNHAVEAAAQAVPGARYVDIFSTINEGRYSDELTIDGRRVLARQPDGIHFSREGAVVPVRLILRAMARDYEALRGATP